MGNFSALRKRAGLTQARLAKLSGLRQATISQIEQGLSHPQKATKAKLARALQCSVETVEAALLQTRLSEQSAQPDSVTAATLDWAFMSTLDRDLRKGLAEALVSDWTHHSTSLEGNTISAGDTLFIIQEGLTISGKSLREHQEIHGHAQAVGILTQWLSGRKNVRVNDLHLLHRAVQTGVTIDIYAPVGAWKNEPNGTMVITTKEEKLWHDYSKPSHVPELMKNWLNLLADNLKTCSISLPSSNELVKIYTDLHLSFTSIHPYADGNGRLARLMANLPLLKAGFPPIIVASEFRKEYITLLGDYTVARPAPISNDPLILPGQERDSLQAFFQEQWQTTMNLVETFHKRQHERTGCSL